MVLNYRILDVATNQIIYSDDYEKELDLSKISKKLKYFTNLVVEEIGPNIIDEIVLGGKKIKKQIETPLKK